MNCKFTSRGIFLLEAVWALGILALAVVATGRVFSTGGLVLERRLREMHRSEELMTAWLESETGVTLASKPTDSTWFVSAEPFGDHLEKIILKCREKEGGENHETLYEALRRSR